jgi:hypothetical protein
MYLLPVYKAHPSIALGYTRFSNVRLIILPPGRPTQIPSVVVQTGTI